MYIAAEMGAGVWKPAKFLQSHPVSYPFLLDEDRFVTKAYGLYHRLGMDAIDIAHPATLVVDRGGMVRSIYRGDSQTDRAPFDQVLAAVKAIGVRLMDFCGRVVRFARKLGGGMKKILVLLGVMLLAVAAGAQTNMALPAGTAFKVKLETRCQLTSKEGDAFSGRVVDAVMLDGKTDIPVGATVQGRVIKVNEPRRIAGKPTIGIFPEAVVLPNGERYMLNATMVDTNLRNGTDVNTEGQFKGDGHDGHDLTEIGFGTGGGMLIGGLAGGGKGLLIGGAVGATLTVAHWLGKSVPRCAVGHRVDELSRPLAMAADTGGQ